MTDEPEVYPPCHCGREVRKLNAASDDAKCSGCGYPPDLCRCYVALPHMSNQCGGRCEVHRDG